MAATHQERGAEKPTLPGFELFDLSVSLGPGLVPWISAASRLGHVHGIPRHDPEVPPLADLLDSVYDFVDAVKFAERDSPSDLRRALGQLVFGEPAVMELFQATRGVAADHSREMLVRILASPHLAALPWELLPDPGKSHYQNEDTFLALAPDVSVVRLARGRTYPIRGDRLEPPLNLLVVLSSPSGLGPADESLSFDIYEEKRSLLAELEPLVDAGLLRVDIEDKPTLQNLRRRIGAQRRGYHLFHYIGHAEPDRLILEDEAGRRDDQSASRFMEVLRLCPDLRLAVFAGCETARASGDPLTVDVAASNGWRNILSLADRCVQESCPVVVGMQAVLAFRTERLFTRYFYQGIASGYSVTGAMRLARTATRGDRHVGGDLLDWSVPVLFVGGAEPGPLLDRSSRGVPSDRPARHVLRIGLRQRETRFFARDVALRQAIDVLSGKTPERVLALTGPAEVGKTTLIDRALEEIDGPVSILYVRLQDLAPEFEFAPDRRPTAQGSGARESWFSGLAEMDTQAPLDRLCQLVAELLKREDGRLRDPQQGQTPSERWVRLIEDLAARRFVLVIDDIDVLVKLEETLTKRVTEYWLRRQVEQVLDAPGGRPLRDLLGELIDQVHTSSGYTQSPIAAPNLLMSRLHELDGWLGGWNRVARACVTAEAENWLKRLDFRPAELTAAKREDHDRRDEQEQLPLRAAAVRLADTRKVLSDALRIIADRRSGVRLAVVADKLPDEFLDLPSEQRFVMRLGRLTWLETWRWIRRNLPGLLRYGDDYLERLWPRLGANLELWEELERQILKPAAVEPEIPKIVDEIAPRKPSDRRVSGPGIDRPRGARPLRVAVTGPHIASAEALAFAITRLASEHGVGGRVVAGQENERGSLAVLLDVPSPFQDTETVDEAAIIRFLQAVSDRQPDIVLLDYGYAVRLPLPDSNAHERPLLRRLRQQVLLIAAGGNERAKRVMKEVTAPGAYPEVLTVGSIGGDGQLQPYTEWIPELMKPDLFMPDQLLGTALESALTTEALHGLDQSPLGPGTHGSSFAAIYAVGAAILVWSTLPNLTPDELRHVLRRASRPVETRAETRPLALTVQAAVAQARQELIRRALQEGPCALLPLAAITGLDPWLVSASLEVLLGQGEIRRLTRGRLERYELIAEG
jgi:CHAT domain/Subtilase family